MKMNFKLEPLALLRSLEEENSRCAGDVTLLCKDGRVSSHSILLAAASPLLGQALLGCPRELEMITVITPWCSVRQMNRMLDALVGRTGELEEYEEMSGMYENMGIGLESGVRHKVTLKVEANGYEMEGSQLCDEEDNYHDPSDFSIQDDDVRIPKVELEVSGESIASPSEMYRNGSVYHCSSCSYSTNMKDAFDKHDLTHLDSSERKVYKCDVCHKEVLDYARFKQHISGACNMRKQTPAMIKASQAASEIVREVDMDGKKVFGCTKCDYTNELRYKTIRHCYKHTKIFPYQCELCEEMFRDDRACKEHVTRDHDGVKQYSCDQCATMFTSKTSLQSHLKRHSIPADLFKCEVVGCDFSSNLKGTLQKHIERRHTSENKTHLCNSCGKTFFDKVDLARHEESIHVVPHLPCRYCPKLYPTERHRAAHESRVHSTELRFQCDECPMRYRHPSSLQKHILSAHRGEEARKYKCNQCGKGFITNGKLMAHERIHTGEKKYACPYCGLRFTDSSAMSRHRKIHEGGNKHTCDICGKTYSQSYDVVKHKTAVHGVVPTKQWEHHYKGEAKECVKLEEVTVGKGNNLFSQSSSVCGDTVDADITKIGQVKSIVLPRDDGSTTKLGAIY